MDDAVDVQVERVPHALIGVEPHDIASPDQQLMATLPAPPEFTPLAQGEVTEGRALVQAPLTTQSNPHTPLNHALAFYFRQFFNACILSVIVENTNLYAVAMGAGAGRAWHPLTVPELEIWIGMVIYMGVYQSKRCADYWNKATEAPQHHIHHMMSELRFEQIRRFLHVSTPPQSARRESPWDKVRVLSDHIRQISQSVYHPSSNVSVDEMMVRFQGRSLHTIKMKNKPISEGYKIFAICDRGFTFDWRFSSRIDHIDGISRNPQLRGSLSPTSQCVLELAKSLPYGSNRYTVFMDNYFSNVDLFVRLRELGIAACVSPHQESGCKKR